MAKKKSKKQNNNWRKPPESIYYYTFAYEVCPIEDYESGEIKNKSVQVTDMILRGSDPKMLNAALDKIVTEATKHNLHVFRSPQPMFIKRKKKEMISFYEESKSQILKNEERLRNE